MKKLSCSLYLVFMFFFAVESVHSQSPPMKFGKLDEANINAEYCPIDSNAHAYYIFDYGYSYFQYASTKVVSNDPSSGRKGFQLFFKRHLRIKILDNQGFDWADFSIPVYHDEDEEKVLSIKGCTYVLENGKLEKYKLDKRDIMEEESSEHWNVMKFAMPNITEGAIIEVEYTIQSDYIFNLREWYFQRTIPVLHSEYWVDIPEYFKYNQTMSGYYPVQTETKTERDKLTITYVQKAEGLTVEEYTSTQDYEFTDNIYHYTAKDIPAFPDEKYVKTINNYLTCIEFELEYTRFPNQAASYYTTSWEEIDKDLLENEYFGNALGKIFHLKKDISHMLSLGEEGESLLNSAFNYFKKKYAWNGSRSKYLTASLSKAVDNGGGNCADVNLNLVVLLKELGYNTYPVILSTQDNGIIHPSHPSVSSFNYVIAMVELNGEVYLMDATDPSSEINLLPERCLNDKGRIIGNYPEKWINLMDYKTYIATRNYELSFNDDMSAYGTVKISLQEYGAYDLKKDVMAEQDVDAYIASVEEKNTDFTMTNMKIDGLDEVSGGLDVSYDLSDLDMANVTGDMVFVSPVIKPFFDENPFKLEEREFPVEFNYPHKILQYYTITIPDGYEVSELPEAMLLKLPDNSITYRYQVVRADNKINLITNLNIGKSFFISEEYAQLKQLFQIMIDKEKEYVVLKSKNE